MSIITQEEEILVSAVESQEHAAYKSMRVISLDNMLELTRIIRRIQGLCAEFRSTLDALTEENNALKELVDVESEDA